MITFEFWFMFPIAIIVATLAMSTLVGGATFFSPFFILVLKLEPQIAIATGLTIQFFGFSTGFLKYYAQKCIDFKMGTMLLIITVPYALFGTFLSTKLNPYFIRILLSFILLYIGYSLLVHNRVKIKHIHGRKDKYFTMDVFQRKSNKIKLRIDDVFKKIFQTAAGSLIMGITSAGLGEILGSFWIKRSNTSIKTIVATTIYIVAATTFITSIFHLYNLNNLNPEGIDVVISIIIFAIPGVIIGASLGTKLVNQVDQKFLQKMISIILIITGVICFIPL